MNNQHTSSTTKPVGSGLAKHLGRMVEDAMLDYPGGTAMADLAKGHPGFSSKLYAMVDNLASEQALRLPIINRPAWKTIRLGIHKHADEYREAIKTAGGRISDWADDILGKSAFTVIGQPTDIDLVIVTVAELGYEKGATRADIYKRAAEFGLEPCPAEVGPALREQYMDQPKGEWLLIAMEPILDSDGDPSIFAVGRDAHDLCLYSDYGRPGSLWSPVYRWVFVRK